MAGKNKDRNQLRFLVKACSLSFISLESTNRLVSPQFHCSYDDLFETTTGTQARSIPKYQWQHKMGFVKEPSRSTQIGGEQETGVIPFSILK